MKEVERALFLFGAMLFNALSIRRRVWATERAGLNWDGCNIETDNKSNILMDDIIMRHRSRAVSFRSVSAFLSYRSCRYCKLVYSLSLSVVSYYCLRRPFFLYRL